MNSALRRMYYDQFKNLNGKEAVVSYQSLRSDVDLSGAVGNIIFPFQQSGNTQLPKTSFVVGTNDAFAICEMMLFLSSHDGTDSGRSTARLYTNANPQKFGNATNLEALYNSGISITTNTVKIIPYQDTQIFKRVGMPQEQVAQTVTAGILAGSSSVFAQDYTDGMTFVSLDEPVVFGGTSNFEFKLNLPTALTLTGGAPGGTTNTATMILRGFYIQNASGGFIKK